MSYEDYKIVHLVKREESFLSDPPTWRFEPGGDGFANKTFRSIWKWMQKAGVVTQVLDSAVVIERIPISKRKVYERIAAQLQEIRIHNYDLRTSQLVCWMGTQDFEELIVDMKDYKNPSSSFFSFTITTEELKGSDVGNYIKQYMMDAQILGLRIHVCPWMKGVLVVPR